MDVAILKLRNFLLNAIYNKNYGNFINKLLIKLFLWIENRD